MMDNKSYCLGKRHVVTIFGFLLCTLLNANRLVISVAIVAMVKHPHTNESDNSNANELSCPLPLKSFNTTITSEIIGEMDWDSKQQGYVLGASFLGFLLTQVIGGKIADTIGAKSPLVVSNIVTGACTFISPFAARWNIYAILIVQFVRGLSQGFLSPAVFRLMSNWYPKSERGFLSSLVVTGYAFGMVLGGIVTGWICDVPYLGWPSAFYFWGALNAGIGISLHFLLYEYPQNHPSITEAEMKCIIDGQESNMSEKRHPTPWREIFTSVPCYACFYGLFGYFWSMFYFISVHPMYMGTVLHFPMTQNGTVSCLPVLLNSLSGLAAGILSNWLIEKKYIGINKLRKICNSIGSFGFSLSMLGVILAGCDITINILCFSISLFATGIALSAIVTNSMDLSPVFSGSLTGVANTIGSTSTAIIPLMTGYLTTDRTLSEWHSVFWISIAVVGSSGIVFMIFGSAEVQSWNFPEAENPRKFLTGEETQKDVEFSTDAHKNINLAQT
ncbi:hypothetical protein NPIL_218381 [Nephila pilipes]|uniref:Major facilitator superfamily (MFS) profile domain-containing protein n=1 Tax=Nephila pilipes TaxID=299642 RepID=A0A8X6P8S2_NEPPI|nr:hypothetical protein NPIL_218381 [Nephila pilipes]